MQPDPLWYWNVNITFLGTSLDDATDPLWYWNVSITFLGMSLDDATRSAVVLDPVPCNIQG
jgi:hypothetical protein